MSSFVNCPKFLQIDTSKTNGLVKEVVNRKDFTISVDELLIVEYYSRKV